MSNVTLIIDGKTFRGVLTEEIAPYSATSPGASGSTRDPSEPQLCQNNARIACIRSSAQSRPELLLHG